MKLFKNQIWDLEACHTWNGPQPAPLDPWRASHSPGPLALWWKISTMCPSFKTYCNFNVCGVECYFKCSLFEKKVHLKCQSTDLFPWVRNSASCSRNRSRLGPRSPRFCSPQPHPSPLRVTLLISSTINSFCLFLNFRIAQNVLSCV